MRTDTRTVAVDVAVLVIFFGSIVWIGVVYFTNTQYTSSFRFTESYPNMNGPGKIAVFVIAVNYTANVFSAQNKIKVSVIITDIAPSNTQYSLISFEPMIQYLFFPGSSTGVYNSTNGVDYGVVMTLNRLSNGDYKGSTTVQYNQEGQTCLILNSTYTTNGRNCDFTNANTTLRDPPALNIEPADSLFQYQNNKLTTGLALLVFAFTAILVREVLIAILKDFSKWRKRENPKNSEEYEEA